MKGTYNAGLFFVIDNMLQARVVQKGRTWTAHSLVLYLQQRVNVEQRIRWRTVRVQICYIPFRLPWILQPLEVLQPCLVCTILKTKKSRLPYQYTHFSLQKPKRLTNQATIDKILTSIQPTCATLFAAGLAFRSVTNFMELSPPWAAASCADTQELPNILWNPKVHYRVHNSRPLAPSWARSIQSILTNPISLRSILTSFIHLRHGLPSGLLPCGFHTNILYAFLLFPIRATCPPAHLILIDLIILIIFGEECT
jgi:hypothetical protein